MHTTPRLNQVWKGRGKPQTQIARSAFCKTIQLSLPGYATAFTTKLLSVAACMCNNLLTHTYYNEDS